MIRPNAFPGRPVLRQATVTPPNRQSEAEAVIKTGRAVQSINEQRQNAIAVRESMIHLSKDTVFDLTNSIRNPADLGGAVLPTILLSYLVPAGFVLKVNKIGITYSNPLVPMSQCVGWRVTVNGERVPNIFATGDEYFYSSFGQVNDPLEIEPLWIQANGTLAIEVYPRFGFNQQLTISGRVAGRIYKPANPELIGATEL